MSGGMCAFMTFHEMSRFMWAHFHDIHDMSGFMCAFITLMTCQGSRHVRVHGCFASCCVSEFYMFMRPFATFHHILIHVLRSWSGFCLHLLGGGGQVLRRSFGVGMLVLGFLF